MSGSEYAPPSGSVILVRYGGLPPDCRSKNHLTGTLEAGISVYEAILRDGAVQIILPSVETPGLVSLSGVNERPLYEVAGVLVGRGSDGEPLLNPCRIVRDLSPNDMLTVSGGREKTDGQ